MDNSHQQILETLVQINEKIDYLSNTVIAIDVSITGDEKRGVDGFKQRVESLENNFDKHCKDDVVYFDILTKRTDGITKRLDGAKQWIAGGLFVASSFISLVVVFVNFYVKSK
jgi:hypothetical protein